MILKKENILKLKLDSVEIQKKCIFYIYKDIYEFETYDVHAKPSKIITNGKELNYEEFLKQLAEQLGYTKYDDAWIDIQWSGNYIDSKMENFIIDEVQSITLNLVLETEEFGDWVILIGGYTEFYSGNKDSTCADTCTNFEKAVIFKNTTKEKVRKIADEKFRGLRCPVIVMEYNKAKEEYEKQTYVDPKTKNYRWGKYIDIKAAIKLNQSGKEIIGYRYNNDIRTFNKDELPLELPIDIILNAKWRIIEKNI